MMKTRLSCTPVPIQLPIGSQEDFKGVIDLVSMKAIVYLEEALGAKYEYQDIPEDLKQEAEEARVLLRINCRKR